MIQELREYSKSIFFKILLGIIAITFVLSFGVGGFFGDRKEVIATVNDNEILLNEYNEKRIQINIFDEMTKKIINITTTNNVLLVCHNIGLRYNADKYKRMNGHNFCVGSL